MKKTIGQLICAAICAASVLAPAQTAFCEAKAVDYFVTNGTVTGTASEGDYILIPSEESGEEITKIGDDAFAGKNYIGISLEMGIEEIGSRAFEGCKSLEDFQSSASLKKIGAEAFKDCPHIGAFSLPGFDVEIGKDAFKGTGHIFFNVSCEGHSAAAEKKLYDAIAAAKGDTKFTLTVMHDYVYDGKDGGLVCAVCGDYIPADAITPDDGPGEYSTTYIDVPRDAWYYDYVDIATQFGLLNGKGDGYFKPDDNITVAEAAKISACAHDEKYGQGMLENAAAGENWYDKYIDYCKNNGIIEPNVELDPTKPATRAEIAYIFSRCDRDKYFINEVPITDIPDVDYTTPYFEEILDMFNMGAAVGSDARYTFHPDDNIKRSEAAAMIVRILCYDLRIGLPKG